jgi:uncharacterized protein YdhG (YjbR/CyaY superfamily)
MNKTGKIFYKTVDEYIKTFPEASMSMLQTLRRIIKEEAPEAVEVISYNMSAFKFKGILCYYAAQREHIGFYPASAQSILHFKDELAGYKTSKGTIQFPLGKDIPEDLVRKVIRYRLEEKAMKGKKGSRS